MPHEKKDIQKRWLYKSEPYSGNVWPNQNFLEKAKKSSHATIPLNLAFPDQLVLRFLVFLNKPLASASLYVFLIDCVIYLDLRASLSWSADLVLTRRRGGLCSTDCPALQHPHQQPGPGPPSAQGMLTMLTMHFTGKREGGGNWGRDAVKRVYK